jgi:hypothetical protein
MTVSPTQPNYIAQGRAETREEKNEWWKARAVEAVTEGCTFSRASVYADDESLILFEAWQVAPRNQGEPRWFMTSQALPTAERQTEDAQ